MTQKQANELPILADKSVSGTLQKVGRQAAEISTRASTPCVPCPRTSVQTS
jgi:hypothetical protein